MHLPITLQFHKFLAIGLVAGTCLIACNARAQCEDDFDCDGVPNLVEDDAAMNKYDPDSDHDGMADYFEWSNILNGLSPTDPDDAEEDFDSDGLTNLEEYQIGTDLWDSDTDNDQITDYNEDSDGDGLSNGAELHVYGSNPFSSDSDIDGLPDGWEASFGLDPATFSALDDPDGDGSSNLYEYNHSTNPTNSNLDANLAISWIGSPGNGVYPAAWPDLSFHWVPPATFESLEFQREINGSGWEDHTPNISFYSAGDGDYVKLIDERISLDPYYSWPYSYKVRAISGSSVGAWVWCSD